MPAVVKARGLRAAFGAWGAGFWLTRRSALVAAAAAVLVLAPSTSPAHEWFDSSSSASALEPEPTPTPTPEPTPEPTPTLAPVITHPLELVPLYAYGHSYVAGEGATTPARSYVSRLGNRIDASTTDNNGISGAVIGRVVEAACSVPGKTWTPNSKGLVVLDAVLNSVVTVRSPADAAEKVDFPNSLRTLLRLFRSYHWIPETSPSVVRTGTWTASSVGTAGGGAAIKTSAPGSKLTITTTANEISLMVIGFRPSEGRGSPYSVTVNGVPYGSGTTVGQTTEKNGFHDISYRVAGLTGTSKIVVTKGSGGGELYFDGYLDKSAAPPGIVVVKDPTPSAAGLAFVAADTNHTAANLAVFNGMIDSVVAEPEFDDGTIVVADPGAIWNPVTMFAPDRIHPNNIGHSVIADVIQNAAEGFAYRKGLATF